jgi:hypothetical protein
MHLPLWVQPRRDASLIPAALEEECKEGGVGVQGKLRE